MTTLNYTTSSILNRQIPASRGTRTAALLRTIAIGIAVFGLFLAGCSRDSDEESVAEDTTIRDEAVTDTGMRDSPMAQPDDYGEPMAETADPGGALSRPDSSTGPNAIAVIKGTDGSAVAGELHFEQEANAVQITGELKGLEPGKHELYVQEESDCGEATAGSDEDTTAPESADEPAAGDLGTIVADEKGLATIDLVDSGITLTTGPDGIIGKTIVVQAGESGATSGPSAESDSGEPVACGVIQDESLAQS
jgi:Cu-Zn family superoxide dismutase